MRMFTVALQRAILVLSSIPVLIAALDSSHPVAYDTIEKDVVIIGGGATGSHAAVRLREDYNKTVILIEKEPILVSSSLVTRVPR
jgi:heterodisulfide reductase subunit A-like polyferredoxin